MHGIGTMFGDKRMIHSMRRAKSFAVLHLHPERFCFSRSLALSFDDQLAFSNVQLVLRRLPLLLRLLVLLKENSDKR